MSETQADLARSYNRVRIQVQESGGGTASLAGAVRIGPRLLVAQPRHEDNGVGMALNRMRYPSTPE